MAVLITTAVVAAPVAAKDCGGAVACACGDRVVASVTLPGHLDGCDEHGLVVDSGTLDCGDHQISGPGANSGFGGVVLEGDGVTVRNCRVRNFTDGIRVEGGDGSLVADNVVFDNLHGVWVGGGVIGTRVEGNDINDNEDEGIHLGSGTSGSEVRNNQIYSNDAENVYLLLTSGNLVEDNVLGSAGDAGIYVKHSHDNDFLRNEVGDRPILVRGDSYGNHFEDNLLLGGGYVFEALEEDDVWTYPHGQTVVGGSVDASTCFEFLGSYENQVTDTVVDDCRHVEEKEYGDLEPYGNVVSVIDISPGSGSSGSGGTGSGSTGARKGKVKLSKVVGDEKDTLKLDFAFTPASEIDPAGEVVEITLSDDDSIVWRATLPAGSLVPKGSRFSYKAKPEESPGGVKKLRLSNHPFLGWSASLRARTNLDEADEAGLELEWRIGDDEARVTDQWEPKTSGWQLDAE